MIVVVCSRYWQLSWYYHWDLRVACGGRSPGHWKGRAEKLWGELAVWKVRMLMLLWEAARLPVMLKVMIGLMRRGDVSWPLHFLKCACDWKQMTKPSKFTCKEIYHTKGSLCRCSLSFSLITDISSTLSPKAPLLSISAQCTSFFSVNITHPQSLKTSQIKLTSPIQCTCCTCNIFFFFLHEDDAVHLGVIFYLCFPNTWNCIFWDLVSVSCI